MPAADHDDVGTVSLGPLCIRHAPVLQRMSV